MSPIEQTLLLLAHPVRLRIHQSLEGRRLSRQQLGVHLGDVPSATLYRHLKALESAGLVEAVDTRRSGANDEMIYTTRHVVEGKPQDFESLAGEDVAQMFNVFALGLLAEFQQHLQREDHRRHPGQAWFGSVDFYASDAEYPVIEDRLEELFDAIAAEHPATPGRRRRRLTYVAQPLETAVPTDEEAGS